MESAQLLPMPDNGQMIAQGDERKLSVRFYKNAIKNNVKSVAAGRAIFDEFVMVEIQAYGDKLQKHVAKVTDEHKQKYPVAWQRFERGLQFAPTGTPLEHWAMLVTSEVAEFKAMNVFTVEQLAELPDAITSKHTGLAYYRDQAKLWLKAATDQAVVAKLAEEKRQLEERFTAMESQNRLLATRLEQLLERLPPEAQVAERSAVAGTAASVVTDPKAPETPEPVEVERTGKRVGGRPPAFVGSEK